MKATPTKTSYPIVSKITPAQGLDVNFNDANLREPFSAEKSPVLDDISINSTIRHGSEVFDTNAKNTNYDKGIFDLRNTNTLAMSKSQTSLYGNSKQKKLKPLGSRGSDIPLSATQTNLKSIDYGLSDFYLKNFLGRQRLDTEMIRGNNAKDMHQVDSGTIRSATLDNRKVNPGKQIQSELAQLALGQGSKAKFYDSLAVSYKEFYMDKKEFMKTFDDIDVAVFCLDEVVDKLKCYRFELGSLLEKVGFSYKRIMEKMLELTMKICFEKDMIHERKMEENFQGIKLLENEKKGLEEKNKQYKNLSDVTESEANIYKFNVKSLQNEVSMLYELLKKDYLIQDKLGAGFDEHGEPELSRPQDAVEPSKLLANNLLSLQESIKHLESEQNSKEGQLQEMNNLLKAMLRGGKKEASTQVNEGELAWAAKNIISDEDYKPKPLDYEMHEASTVNVDPHISSQIVKEEVGEGVDPVHVLKFKEKMDKKEGEESAPTELVKEKGGKNAAGPASGLPNTGPIMGDNWNLPLSMIVFLENVTKGNKTANVLPWPFFKRILYEIYQDKIANTMELQNVLINTNVTMSEYLPIYFLKTCRLRRTAEMKLLEFAVSLKYYIKTWQRATTFANMCNITNIKLESTGLSYSTLPDFDIYAQSFYLFAFSKATNDPANVYDHPDGTSYLVKERTEELTNEILSFDTEPNRKKFIANLTKYSKTFNDNGKEGEGVDVDKLLHLYMETYFEVKNRNDQAITKQFYKQQNSGEGVFSLDEIFQMVSDIIDVESPLPGYAYPKELSVCRAFLYSLTSGKNSFGVTYKDFIHGMARFGIDCPFPFINLSIQGGAGAFNSAASLVFGDDKNAKKTPNNSSKKGKVAASPGMKSPNVKVTDFTKKLMEEETSSQGSIKIPIVNADKDGKKKKDDGKGETFKIDSASTLFAQHFSIIRELKAYCNQFKDMLGKENDVQKVWKGFDQIVGALDAGCQFLSYPVTL